MRSSPLTLALVAGALAACSSSTPTDAAAGALPASFTLRSDAASVEVRTAPFSLRVLDASGQVVLETLGDDVVVAGDATRAYGSLGVTHRTTIWRPLVVEGWDHAGGEDAPWHHASRVVAATYDARSASLDLVDPVDGTTRLHVDLTLDGADLLFDAHAPDGVANGPGLAGSDAEATTLNELGQGFVLAADEHLFGLGERYEDLDHTGRAYGCWAEEGGVGLGESPAAGATNPLPNGRGMTHLPVPFLLSTRGYGLWLDTTFRTTYALGSDDPAAFRFAVESPRLRYHVLVHADPLATIGHYTQLTGRAHLPAPWVFGPRRRVGADEIVDGVPEWKLLRQRKVPTTMADDTTHFLPYLSQTGREAQLAAWTKAAHEQGFKAIGYFNAYVGVEDAKPEVQALVDEGRAHGYFVRADDGTELDTTIVSGGARKVATIDVTNPDAVTWFHGILQRALDLGYDGWMLDFGEYLPQRALLHDGRTGWEAHDAFPLDYQRAVTDWMREQRGDDWMYFARAGYAGTQALAPVVWSGDPAASFDDVKGLPAQVRAGLGAGIAGIPFWGSDISGYTCINQPPVDKELYLRWAEFGALSPDMHDENACASAPAGSPPKWTLWSDAETTRVYGDYARLHTRLLPYLYAAAKHAVDTGAPIMRHPVLVHPDVAEARAAEFDYFFGPALYVAPVVRRGARSRSAWLPPGRWVDWWTLEAAVGGRTVTRDAPLDVLPMWLASGGVVALLDPDVETLAPESSPDVVGMGDRADVLDVRVAIDAATGTATATLVDGTLLTAELGAAPIGAPAGLAAAPDDATLASCAGCARLDAAPGGVQRVRVTTAKGTDVALDAGGLRLHHTAPAAVRVRWDVAVLPPG